MTWTDFNEYNSDVQFQIGQRIQKLRIDKKIAAVDLAAVLDIQSNQMSRIENGRANCTDYDREALNAFFATLKEEDFEVVVVRSDPLYPMVHLLTDTLYIQSSFSFFS